MKIVMGCLAILIAVAGMGCVGLRNQRLAKIQEAMKESDRITMDCRTQKLQGKIATWVEAVQCANDPTRQIMMDSGYPHMDLINLMLATRAVLAERMDAGQLTLAEAEQQLAALHTLLVKEEQARAMDAQASANAASQAYSQRLMGFGAAMQGLGTLNQSLKPPPPPTVIVPLGR